MKRLLLMAIKLYQAYISPRKGFRCACHAWQAQRPSCSNFGYRVIARYGALRGLALLRLRLQDCSRIYRTHFLPAAPRPRLHPQAGLVDCDCGGADCTPGDKSSCACDCLSSVGDCFDFRRDKKRQKHGTIDFTPPPVDKRKRKAAGKAEPGKE
ncbi:membrane protein insertion efficiency factor YidD [Massilia sp. W12]|uniref:membrane protein insertion efficiency factor YidD n=1 Tax=Massilia sp. W12 TaxID=3126507 RepID=UPI0030CB9527